MQDGHIDKAVAHWANGARFEPPTPTYQLTVFLWPLILHNRIHSNQDFEQYQRSDQNIRTQLKIRTGIAKNMVFNIWIWKQMTLRSHNSPRKWDIPTARDATHLQGKKKILRLLTTTTTQMVVNNQPVPLSFFYFRLYRIINNIQYQGSTTSIYFHNIYINAM